MLRLIIPDTDINVEDCELISTHRAIGGNLIIKELPYYPPIDCTQSDYTCYELSDYVVLIVGPDESEDMMCTLCTKHLNELLEVIRLQMPFKLMH